MENQIKQIYSVLSGGKEINSEDYVIEKSHFSSILRDRFIAELSKLGIKWDGSAISFASLMVNLKSGAPPPTLPSPRNAEARMNSDFSIGIDIQRISDLPDCADYWEDEFYKTKFTPEEIGYCVRKRNVKESFAGIYCCKEALVKCDNKLTWSDIVIAHDLNGKPSFANYFLSISHSGENAIAIACQDKSLAGKVNLTDSTLTGLNQGEIHAVPKPGILKSNIPLIVMVVLIIAYLVYRDFFLV